MKKHIRLTDSEVINENMLADLINVFALWENNWTDHDFKEAFKESSLGREYFWNKFEVSDWKPYNFFLCLDHEHQIMLVRYIYEQKYQENIPNYQLNRAIFRLDDKEGE